MNKPTAGALLRIGRRSIARNRWRSLLVVALVALPVAGMVGATAIMKTITPSAERIATHKMGRADLEVFPGSGGTSDLLHQRLPAGSVIEPFLETEGTIVVPGMSVRVNFESHDPDGLAQGLLKLVEGRFPVAPGEAAISAEAQKIAKAGIGHRIELKDVGPLTVVGTVEDELQLTSRTVLVSPDFARTAEATGQAVWLVGLPAGTDAGSVDLGADVEWQGQPPTGDELANPPAFIVTSRPYTVAEGSAVGPATIVLGGLALADAALVAAAAFAVGIRRRQRELGLLAAVGAEPRHLAGTVLAEALLLGGLGALVGVAIGIAGALVAWPFLDGLTGHRNPSIALDAVVLVVAALMGLITSVIAAVAPARSAARLPVLAALSGRRPPTGTSRRTLVVGLSLVGVAIALTLLGAVLRLENPTSSASTLLLLVGAVTGTLGFGTCSPWLLGQIEGPARRLPLSGRIAFRDVARARSRNGPLVTALLAAFAATVALAAYDSSLEASYQSRFQPELYANQLMIDGAGSARAGAEAARQLGAVASSSIAGASGDGTGIWIARGDSDDPNGPLTTEYAVIATPEVLATLEMEAAAPDLAAGRLVFVADKATATASNATIHVVRQSDGTETNRLVLPARVLATGLLGNEVPGALIPPAIAAQLGLYVGDMVRATRYLIRLDHPVTDKDVATAASVAAAYPDTGAFASQPPKIADGALRMLLIAVSIVFALSVTAIAVALGESESRREQRTLLAVGADPRVRRQMAAARAGLIALLGGLLAVPAGLLPVWGLLLSRHAPMVVPVPEIVAALAVLPLLAIAATWLISRPIPDWSAFREQASA